MQKSELKMAEGELNVDSLISRLLEGERRKVDDIFSSFFAYRRMRKFVVLSWSVSMSVSGRLCAF